jgi:O-antigen ligase
MDARRGSVIPPAGTRDQDGPATAGGASPVASTWRVWADRASARAAASDLVGRDPTATVLAVVMAVVALGLVARGLTLSESGGILRLAPYASLVLAPFVAALAVLLPWAGLIAWVLLMPALDIARVSVTVGPVQILLPTVIVISLVLGLWRAPARQDAAAADARLLRRAVYGGSGLLIGLTVASLVLGTAPVDRAVPIALHGVVEPAIVLAVAVALRPSWRQVTTLAVAMGMSVALATVFNLVRVVAVRDLLTSSDALRAQLARLTYYNVGIFGDMLVMAIPLLVGGLLVRRALRLPHWGTGLLVAGLATSFIGLYMTLSKSAWLGAAVGLAALFLFLVRSWRLRLAGVAMAAVVTALVVPYPAVALRFVSPDLANAYEQLTSVVNSRSSTIDPSTPEGEVSVTERLLATRAAIEMSVDHPLLGVGPGAFAAAYEAGYRPADSTRALDSAHDLIPYVAAELGLPAAALVTVGLLGAVLLAWDAGRRAPPDRGLERVSPMAIAAALIGFLVVATAFGVDLYRDYRMIDADVVFAALLMALAISTAALARSRGEVAAA